MSRRAVPLALVLAIALLGAARPAAADHDTCTDRSKILGLRKCPRFAAWSDGDLATYLIEWTGGIRTVPATADATDRLFVGAMRVSRALGRHAYLGIDYEMGFTGSHTPVDADAPPNPQGMGSFQSTAYAGVRGNLGRLVLAAELAAGGRLLSRNYDNDSEIESFDTRWDGAPVVEARVRAGLWVAPFWQVGVMIGASPIDDLRTLVLHLGTTTRAFGS